MSAAKHTPGPWRFRTEPQPNGCPIVGAQGLMVAMLAHSVNVPDQRSTALANARLIAAAPELLEACEAMSAHFSGSLDHQPAYVALARAAIAKATGAAA